MWIFLLIVFVAGVGLWIFASHWLMRDIAEPEYRVLLRHDVYEIREYLEQPVAEVDIVGDVEQAVHEGFSLLAGYLFGAYDHQSRLTDTLPPCDEERHSADVHTVVFALLKREQAYPTPHDPRIRLCTLAPRIVAAVPLGRRMTEDHIQATMKRLKQAMEGSGLSCVGMPELVRHHPPFSFPAMLSHELLIEVRR